MLRAYRFLNGQRIKPFSLIPFSAGPRNCVGQALANYEGFAILSMLYNRYKITLDFDPTEFSENSVMLMRPQVRDTPGMPVKMERR